MPITKADLGSYQPVPDWERPPEPIRRGDVAAVAVDHSDNVYVLTRWPACVITYDRNGELLRSWGGDVLSSRPHGITAGPDGAVWVADEGAATVFKFDSIGRVLMKLSDPPESDPPLARPTSIAIAANGEVYVSDGYGSGKIFRFTADGRRIGSFGGIGSGPGQFRLPHALCFDELGRLLVADRGNERIHLLESDGTPIGEWSAQRPNAVVAHDGAIYVGHSAWKPGNYSWSAGNIERWAPAWVSIRDLGGAVVGRVGGGDQPGTPGNFVTAHSVAVDGRHDMYVGDVVYSSQWKDDVASNCPTLQKLEWIDG